jgi:hypothetical protein
MSYAPLYLPAFSLPMTASAAITGGQVVAVSGNNTVAPTSAASGAVVGVASNDAASGVQLPIYTVGVHLLTASGSISAGDTVISAAAGAVATIGSDTTDTHTIGKALAAATNGNTVPVLLTL